MFFYKTFDIINLNKYYTLGDVSVKACGLIVEYNPLHNGHLYHIQKAKEISGADCIIAVMSGSFLQRGEPAIIDKFHRTKAALSSGVDIVLELPYLYAVQSSDLFAKGSVHTLNEMFVSSICFGSESGNIEPFISSLHLLNENKHAYKEELKRYLSAGMSYPSASEKAYHAIGLHKDDINLMQPNNILGFSYVREILSNHLPIKPLTIKRTNSDYHDKQLASPIASATSIRGQLLDEQQLTDQITETMPSWTKEQLIQYNRQATKWHHWEDYFSFVRYRVQTMSPDELREIHGVEEGLEYRLKKSVDAAGTFDEWLSLIKTRRYTWTRLQRLFVHLLTNTKKQEMEIILNQPSVPYIRLLGLTDVGREYLNENKKRIDLPIVRRLGRNPHPLLRVEERATKAYYSILPHSLQRDLFTQELQTPIIV